MASSDTSPRTYRGGLRPPFFLLVTTLVIGMAHAETNDGTRASRAPSGPNQEESTRPDYRIGVGDLIRIQVHGEEDLTLETRIDSKGTVTYPFLGDLKVAGKTVRELESQIVAGLKPDYLLFPEVQVLVLEYRPFFVNGEVKRPGGYPYIPGLTVQKAITLAGGFTDLASKNKIYLVREHSAAGKREKITLESVVSPGDTVLVEEGLF